jgi:hypothetical protein
MKVHASIQNDRRIIDEAVNFEVSIFLGRGQFAKAEAPTLERAEAERLFAEHRGSNRIPVIYAVNAAGRTCPIPFKPAPRFRSCPNVAALRLPFLALRFAGSGSLIVSENFKRFSPRPTSD